MALHYIPSVAGNWSLWKPAQCWFHEQGGQKSWHRSCWSSSLWGCHEAAGLFVHFFINTITVCAQGSVTVNQTKTLAFETVVQCWTLYKLTLCDRGSDGSAHSPRDGCNGWDIYEPVTKGRDLKWDTLPQNQTPSKLFSVLPLESGMFQVTISIIKKWFWSKCVLYGIKTGVRSGVDVCNNGHSECHNNTEKNHLYAILMLLVHLSSC